MGQAGKDRADNIKKRKQAFLEAYRECGTVSNGCRAAGVPRCMYYEWYNSDPEFAAECKLAKEDAVESLEAEARRRAYNGCTKPVYQSGRKVGEVIEYSDSLMMFLLKGEKPDKYKDRVAQESSGPNGGPQEFKIVVEERV